MECKGKYREPVPELSFANFVSSLMAKAIMAKAIASSRRHNNAT